MALTKVVRHLSSTPSIVDGGNATAITIDSSENVTLSGHLNLGDNDYIKLGDSSDLLITHDGSGSWIIDNGTGGLVLASNSLSIKNAAYNEQMITAYENGAVELYHDNNKKLETTSAGITVTGTITGTLASTVTATTQSATDNSTKIATTAYTDAAITALVGGAPSTLDTLNEIAASINDDANYVGTVNNLIAGKAPLASPTFTGGLTLNSGHVNIDSGLSYQWGDSHERIEQSDGKIEFFTNNGESMTLSGSNLGIGDVNPADKLSIKADTGHLRLKGSTTATKGLALLFDHSNNRSEIRSDQAGVNQLDLNYYALDHHFGRNASNITMTLTDLNQVGIGTTGPQSWAKLEVVGTAGAQTGAKQALYIRAATATANEGVGIRMSAASGSHEAVGIIGMVNNASGNAGSMTFHTYNLGATIPEVMRIDNTGRVGINTNNPQVKLQVNDTGTAIPTSGYGTGFNVSRADGLIGMTMGFLSTDNTMYIQGRNFTNTDSQPILLNPNGGKIGIGVSSPGAALTVSGPASLANLGGGSTGSAAIYVNSTSGHVGEMLQLLKNGSNRLTILNNGQATFAGKIVSETTDSQFYNRLFIKNGNDGLYMGQWDGSNHRIEADASRPLTIQAYNSNGIYFGLAGNNKVQIVGAQLKLSTDVDLVQTVSSGGGDYHHITHSGNEAWSWGARSGSGSNDYLDVGISGGTKAMTWHEDGKVGIGTTAPSSLLHIQSNDSTTNDAVNMIFLTALSTGTTTTGFGPAIVFQAERNSGVNQNVGKIRSVAEVNSGTNISSGLSFETGTAGVLDESMRIRYDGKVGIGTNNPLSRLQIGNFTSSTEQLNFAVSQNGTSKIFFTDNNATEGGYVKNTGTTYGSDFVFGGTWNTDLDSVAIRVRQNSSSQAASQWKAKMGIGTTAPIAGLEVRGFNENKDATDADDATGAEEPILMLRGANGAAVSEWIHSTKATAPSGGTQTAMTSWYRFDMPGGWSGTGTPGFLEIHNQMSGMHASGSAVEKFFLNLPNEHGSIATQGGLQRTSISRWYAYTANVGAYTTSLSTSFYHGNSSSFGYAAGAIFMKVVHASREPIFTMYAKYIGGTGASRNYPQKLHFLGTESTNNHQPSNISALTVYDGRGML